MRAIGVREALGGPWEFSAFGWFVLFVPGTVLTIVLTSATPFPHFGYVLLIAIAQHVASGIVPLSTVALLRRRGLPLPIWLSFTLWTTVGLSRGLIGGLLASAWANVDPEFALRITVWLLASWIWLPLFSYTAAQSQNRRTLLASLGNAVAAREAAQRLRTRPADDIREQLIRAIQSAVDGAIDDIRTALAAARSSLDPIQLRSIGGHLASVSRQVGMVVDRVGRPAAGQAPSVPSAGAPLLSALRFERRRPWVASVLASLSLGVVVAPLCVSVHGWSFLAEFGLAMLVSTCVLALESRIVPTALSSLRRQVAWVVARYGMAGLSAAVLLAAMRWSSLDTFTTVFILVLPCGVAFSAFVVSGAVGLAAANQHTLRSLAAIEAERSAIEAVAVEEENDIRDQLSEVMHGPVLGRLAACAMALNFHAAVAGTLHEHQSEDLAHAVAAHLDAVTADLDSLARELRNPS